MDNIKKDLEVILKEGMEQIRGGETPPADQICQRTAKPADPTLTNCEEVWNDTYRGDSLCGQDSSWDCDEAQLAGSSATIFRPTVSVLMNPVTNLGIGSSISANFIF